MALLQVLKDRKRTGDETMIIALDLFKISSIARALEQEVKASTLHKIELAEKASGTLLTKLAFHFLQVFRFKHLKKDQVRTIQEGLSEFSRGIKVSAYAVRQSFTFFEGLGATIAKSRAANPLLTPPFGKRNLSNLYRSSGKGPALLLMKAIPNTGYFKWQGRGYPYSTYFTIISLST